MASAVHNTPTISLPRGDLVTAVRAAPVIVLPVLVVLFLADPSLREANLVGFAAVAVLAGLPHGAVDLFLELGPHGVPRGRVLVLHLLAYVGIVAVSFTVILLFPMAGVGAFLAVSAWHFGSAEAAFNACRHGRVPRIAPVETLAYGAPLTVGLLVWWPERVREIIDPLGGPGVTSALVPLARTAFPLALAALTVTVVAKLVAGHRLDVLELLLLWAAALVLPPLASFAVYFALWHSPRHVLRTLAELPANRADLSAGRLVPSVLRYLRYTVPGTLGALAVFAGLILLNATDLRPATWAGACLAALTVPHALTILRYDLWLNRR